jgi:hypothetical protein
MKKVLVALMVLMLALGCSKPAEEPVTVVPDTTATVQVDSTQTDSSAAGE